MREVVTEQEVRFEVMALLEIHDDVVAEPEIVEEFKVEAELEPLPRIEQIVRPPHNLERNQLQVEAQKGNEDDYGEESVAEEGPVRFSASSDRSPIELLRMTHLSRGLFWKPL